jgi:hypothetical protein
VVRDDEHREPLANVWMKNFEQSVDLAFEARRHVMN